MTKEMKAMIELVNQSSKEVKSMSKADKLFEELGFYREERSRYSKRISYGEYMNIDFDLESKQYDKSIEKGWSLRYLEPTKKEHIAIHEKMKELGWLNEQSI